MLRVGLTGDLGSGKSTVAHLLAQRGAVILSSDEMGRNLMQPGEPVYSAIVERFGHAIVAPDGSLDRRELARQAFAGGRIEELNAIVHPAVIAEQARLIAALAVTQPEAIVVVESALIFTTKHSGANNWRHRFDEILLVTAPEGVKISRYVQRATAGRKPSGDDLAALQADARRRLKAQQLPKGAEQDCIVIRNNADMPALEARITDVWRALQRMATRTL